MEHAGPISLRWALRRDARRVQMLQQDHHGTARARCSPSCQSRCAQALDAIQASQGARSRPQISRGDARTRR